jgi:hypothetical protein
MQYCSDLAGITIIVAKSIDDPGNVFGNWTIPFIRIDRPLGLGMLTSGHHIDERINISDELG